MSLQHIRQNCTNDSTVNENNNNRCLLDEQDALLPLHDFDLTTFDSITDTDQETEHEYDCEECPDCKHKKLPPWLVVTLLSIGVLFYVSEYMAIYVLCWKRQLESSSLL